MKTKTNCRECNKEFYYYPAQSKGYFCSNQCQQEERKRETKAYWRPHFEDGVDVGRPRQREFLAEDRGYECSECGISEWQGKKITLQVDHVDGDHENNLKENLRLLCPNCHSQTETFAGANKGKGRWSKGLKKYGEGKSYTHGVTKKQLEGL